MKNHEQVMRQALECLRGVAQGKYDGNAAFVCTALEAVLAEKCSCGDRLAVQCPGEWEPGCDLGSNPKYVVQSELTEPVQEQWEHLKQYGYAPGSYMSRCHNCNNLAYHVDKRAITCRPCAEARHAESRKEEPVEGEQK